MDIVNREYLSKLCNARDVLCNFCEANECEKCIVTCLINDAFNELDDDDDDEYIPSAENGDYGPSNPWDAPGMNLKDFV